MGDEARIDNDITDEVRIDNDGATRFVVIHRPHARNALTLTALDALGRALESASRDTSARCIVLRGAGGHFCAGADLQAAQSDPSFEARIDTYLDAFHAVIRAVVHSPKPVIAAMEGAAVGFGADLAFACDLRVASRDAYAHEKFVRIGLIPDGGGSFWLPRLLGFARAMQSVLLAEPMGAEELHRLGVVARVVDAPMLGDAALELARRIEAGPPLALAAAKRALHANSGSIEEALRRERHEQSKLLKSADFREGVTAWVEKREPRFGGS